MEDILDAPEVGSHEPPTNFAGFWLRFAAITIDGILLTAFGYAMIFIFMWSAMSSYEAADYEASSDGILGFALAYLLYFLLVAGYFVLMESSGNQGTLGKMAVGIKITDMNGDRIDRKRALLRFAGRIPSGFLYIGYLIAAFDSRKQGLHDKIANTLVLMR